MLEICVLISIKDWIESSYIVGPAHPKESDRQYRRSDHGEVQSRLSMDRFARSVVPVSLELPHGHAVHEGDQKR
jgi:hypothetical protein